MPAVPDFAMLVLFGVAACAGEPPPLACPRFALLGGHRADGTRVVERHAEWLPQWRSFGKYKHGAEVHYLSALVSASLAPFRTDAVDQAEVLVIDVPLGFHLSTYRLRGDPFDDVSKMLQPLRKNLSADVVSERPSRLLALGTDFHLRGLDLQPYRDEQFGFAGKLPNDPAVGSATPSSSRPSASG